MFAITERSSHLMPAPAHTDVKESRLGKEVRERGKVHKKTYASFRSPNLLASVGVLLEAVGNKQN